MKKKGEEMATFTATRFDTSENKQKSLADLKKFIKAGMPKERFTKKLYQQLSLHFGHIAHTNLDGFYQVWFQTPKNELAFLRKHRDGDIYGDPADTWSDVRRELSTWLRDNPEIIGDLENLINEATRQRDLGDLEELVNRYPSEARKILEDA